MQEAYVTRRFARDADEVKTFAEIGITDDMDIGPFREIVEAGKLSLPDLIAIFRIADRDFCSMHWREIFSSQIAGNDAIKVAASEIYGRLNIGGFLRPKDDFAFADWFFSKIDEGKEGVLERWYEWKDHNNNFFFNYRYETYSANKLVKEQVFALIKMVMTPAQFGAIKFDIDNFYEEGRVQLSGEETSLLDTAIANLTAKTETAELMRGMIFEIINERSRDSFILYEADPRPYKYFDTSMVTPLFSEES